MRTQRSKFWVDATLYACIGMFMFQQGFLSSDDSYKYVNPYILFWLKFTIGSAGAAAGSIKMYMTDSTHNNTSGKIDLTQTT